RRPIGLHFRFRNHLWILAAETAQDLSLITDEHHAFFGQFLVLTHEFRGHGWFDATIIPEDVQGSTLPLWGKSHANRAGSRKRIVVPDPQADLVGNRADVAGCRFDADRGIQVEELKDRPETVMAHVSDGPAAELVPASEIGVSIVGMIGAIQGWAQPE